MVGEMLLAMEIEDIGHEQEVVVIEGDVLNEAREVILNKPEQDPDTGLQYLSNDVLRTRMKVSLEDVPSSSSFRAQQLNSLSESIKAMPGEMQSVVFPFMVDLMDLPRKKQVVEAIRSRFRPDRPEPDARADQAGIDARLEGARNRQQGTADRCADQEHRRRRSRQRFNPCSPP